MKQIDIKEQKAIYLNFQRYYEFFMYGLQLVYTSWYWFVFKLKEINLFLHKWSKDNFWVNLERSILEHRFYFLSQVFGSIPEGSKNVFRALGIVLISMVGRFFFFFFKIIWIEAQKPQESLWNTIESKDNNNPDTLWNALGIL